MNRRLVRDRLLLHAIHEAYRNILPSDVFPVALLFIELPCEEVDVNVHPAKIEVRFRHSQFVHDFARDTIRQALSKARPIASFAAPGRSTSTGGASGSPGAGAAAAAPAPMTAAPAPMAPPRAVMPWSEPYAGMPGEMLYATPKLPCSRRRSDLRSSGQHPRRALQDAEVCGAVRRA